MKEWKGTKVPFFFIDMPNICGTIKCEVKMINASAWKYVQDEDGMIYRIQVSGINSKNRSTVKESLKDWSLVADGWSNDGELFVYTKKFKDPFEWDKWCKRFKAFNLSVLDKKGTVKKKLSETMGRTCGNCGMKGHNSRTCLKK